MWNLNKDILNNVNIHDSKSLCEQTLALRSCSLGHIRWSALGFQYDWTARKYPQTFSHPNAAEESRPVLEQIFPPTLSQVVKEIVASISQQAASMPELNMTIEPEASIVNYCMVRSVLLSIFKIC